MGQTEITCTIRVNTGERELTLEEMTEEERAWFGDQVRTRPLLSMGYRLEKTAP